MTQNPSYIFASDTKPSRFVKRTANDHEVEVVAAQTDKPCGVSHEGTREAPIPGVDPLVARAGESARVYGEDETCEVLAGAAIAVDDFVNGNTVDLSGIGLSAAEAGVAVVATAGQVYGGRAQAAAAQGEMCRIQVMTGLVPT